MARKLTEKQEAFAQRYALSGNAAEAYRAAYNCGQMTAETIHVNASRLANDTKVALRIAELRAGIAQKAAETFNVTAETLVKELALIGYSRQGKAADGTSVKVSEKVAALAQLCKISGLEKLTVQTLNIDFANDPRFLTFDDDGNLIPPIDSKKQRAH
jgi:hypothetical protein